MDRAAVTVVHGEGGETFADLEDPAARFLLVAGGESLEWVAGARNSRRRLRRVRIG